MLRRIFTCFFVLETLLAFSQISSPGLGKQASVIWLAVGLKEDLDTLSQFQSMTYVGEGRESKDAETTPFKHQGIFVVNQEFYNHFRKHWQYSVALSYRKQNEYVASPPYKENTPSFKQEFRLYGRYMFLQQWDRLKLALTVRQEFRKFYDPAFHPWHENTQLRSRLKAQTTIYLSANKVHRLTFGGEILFTKSKLTGEDAWSDFKYSESRLTGFYSIAPKGSSFIYSIGYMDDVVDERNVPYLSLDVIFKNPFGLARRLRSKSIEYGE